MDNRLPEAEKLPLLEQAALVDQGLNQVQEQNQVPDQQLPDQLLVQKAQPEQDMPPAAEEAVTSLPSYNNNGYSNSHRTDYSSHSIDCPASGQTSIPQEIKSSPRHHSPTMSSQQSAQPVQTISRPSSGLSGGSDRYGYPQSYQDPNRDQRQQQQQSAPSKNSVVIKVGMVGDAQIGKTSLMVKYVEGSWDEDYIQTLGVNFMEKTISIRNTEITFSIWDLGGQREFVNMLPLVCNDAVAILFMFDLTRKSTLNSIKEWYRQGRGFNKTAIPFLIGTKYDHFVNFPREDQEEISIQAKRFAKAMRASLIFSSTSHSINVQKIFKIVLSKAFDLKCTIPEIENIGEPLLLYQSVN
ncbi:septum-promoting GTP-binding protein 1 [Paracoccidioides brasiliensis Pb03]|uniref:Septum-promoting GTP-binding protein 1 n=2 Tax=Paracoccidioides brasiliensis TaxID=121759 RepID=C1GEJ9_PARBD|nr:septum-promoting GTP-binding protein 1 [Paracoccidioides brasiliensis Pb18]EEH22814.2 septum-promoting GTP-binding protein 1 [Paracoccidioides brasiliensis Pb03]EEH49606.2 septum-promoting GTP-binding protein 1 [Paracoccidioides brasiliensis Pb18]ODH39165.1 septum-promoting GTP-binding protein 1 [Paracoccidioides brasiliensis]ODH53199.1 septum-promoting GTP-binding protein 1 [Paracoccidioides brasiliensis]